jgi:hypothetical protein
VVVVDDFKDCAARDENDCQPITKNHVLPGKAFRFEKQAGRQYRFKLVEGTVQKNYEVKG